MAEGVTPKEKLEAEPSGQDSGAAPSAGRWRGSSPACFCSKTELLGAKRRQQMVPSPAIESCFASWLLADPLDWFPSAPGSVKCPCSFAAVGVQGY